MTKKRVFRITVSDCIKTESRDGLNEKYHISKAVTREMDIDSDEEMENMWARHLDAVLGTIPSKFSLACEKQED
jgi:hypothetical protein